MVLKLGKNIIKNSYSSTLLMECFLCLTLWCFFYTDSIKIEGFNMKGIILASAIIFSLNLFMAFVDHLINKESRELYLKEKLDMVSKFEKDATGFISTYAPHVNLLDQPSLLSSIQEKSHGLSGIEKWDVLDEYLNISLSYQSDLSAIAKKEIITKKRLNFFLVLVFSWLVYSYTAVNSSPNQGFLLFLIGISLFTVGRMYSLFMEYKTKLSLLKKAFTEVSDYEANSLYYVGNKIQINLDIEELEKLVDKIDEKLNFQHDFRVKYQIIKEAIEEL